MNNSRVYIESTKAIALSLVCGQQLLDMGQFSKLPAELIQRVASFISLNDTVRLLKVNKRINGAVAYSIYCHIWEDIVNITWLRSMLNQGLIPVLIGHDLCRLNEMNQKSSDGLNLEPEQPGCPTMNHDSSGTLNLALGFILTDDRRAENMAMEQRGEKRPRSYERLPELRSALKPHKYNEETYEVEFAGLNLFIGSSIGKRSMKDPFVLLHPDEDRTMIAYFEDTLPTKVKAISDVEVYEDGSIAIPHKNRWLLFLCSHA